MKKINIIFIVFLLFPIVFFSTRVIVIKIDQSNWKCDYPPQVYFNDQYYYSNPEHSTTRHKDIEREIGKVTKLIDGKPVSNGEANVESVGTLIYKLISVDIDKMIVLKRGNTYYEYLSAEELGY